MNRHRQATTGAADESPRLGRPRLHLRTTSSTNDRARALALAGAPHGTLVTADEQIAGRGRQGRVWTAPAGSALLMSVVLRAPPALLSLAAGVAACDALAALCAETASALSANEVAIKWPNDLVLAGSPDAAEARPLKLGGILVEGRPQEGWAVLGIGLNVAVDLAELPAEVRPHAASLGLDPQAIEPLLDRTLRALGARLSQPVERVLDAWRERDALRGRQVAWTQGDGAGQSLAHGVAEGIDDDGQLLVRRPDGAVAALSAGEVHLAPLG